MLDRTRPKITQHKLTYVYGTDIIKAVAKDQQQASWLTERMYGQKRYYPTGYIPDAEFATMLSNWLVEVRFPTSWEVIREMTGRNSVFIG